VERNHTEHRISKTTKGPCAARSSGDAGVSNPGALAFVRAPLRESRRRFWCGARGHPATAFHEDAAYTPTLRPRAGDHRSAFGADVTSGAVAYADRASCCRLHWVVEDCLTRRSPIAGGPSRAARGTRAA
jgi:hypothetical protein